MGSVQEAVWLIARKATAAPSLKVTVRSGTERARSIPYFMVLYAWMGGVSISHSTAYTYVHVKETLFDTAKASGGRQEGFSHGRPARALILLFSFSLSHPLSLSLFFFFFSSSLLFALPSLLDCLASKPAR